MREMPNVCKAASVSQARALVLSVVIPSIRPPDARRAENTERKPMRFVTFFSLAALIVSLAGTAEAVPVEVGHIDAPQCDPLVVPQFVDELGLGALSGGPFPADEEIVAFSDPTSLSSCPPTQGLGVNFLVTMTNLTPFDFSEVWYVADSPDTTISNIDGDAATLLGGVVLGPAFRIDTVGINKPLVFENGILPGIFESGESWKFIVQEYTNALGLPPEEFKSPGLVGWDSGLFSGDSVSSGSIIAVRAPEPSALVLAGLGLAALAFVRRRAVLGR